MSDDVGKLLAIENDIAARLAPLKTIAAPNTVKEIVSSMSLKDAATYDLIQHPGIAICYDESSGPLQKPGRQTIASPHFEEADTFSIWGIAHDSQGARFARPVLYVILAWIGKLLHYEPGPLSTGRLYRRGKAVIDSGLVGDKSVAILRVGVTLDVLMREDPV
jgi:hypothetical protein